MFFMQILTLAKKDLRLLRRDYRSAIILLLMPLLLVTVLSVAVGDGFGEPPDARLRISVVNLDRGLESYDHKFPGKRWSEIVLDDLAGTADIRIEQIDDLATAEKLIREGKRSAVLIFEPEFSQLMQRCSFLTKASPEPLNPLYRDGINPREVGLRIVKDPTQMAASSIIEQVAQVTLFRVVVPWMIGQAFARVGDSEFMDMLAGKFQEIKPIPTSVLKDLDPVMNDMMGKLFNDPQFTEMMRQELGALPAATFKPLAPKFQGLLKKVFMDDKFLARIGKDIAFGDVMTPNVRKQIGPKVQDGIQETFSNYDFHAFTWAGLTRNDPVTGRRGSVSTYSEDSGLPLRGDKRFQILVPSYAVTFAFFLVLTIGWLFVAERRQGTLTRLRAAPLTRWELLAGKFLPALMLSVTQGLFLILAGRLLFGMSLGSQPLWLLATIVATSWAATGLAMLVASLAKTETQVAVYGTLLVLVLAGIGGSMMPRDLMPESMRRFSYITPHAWSLDAYQQLLISPDPSVGLIATACGILLAFGTFFLGLSWWGLRLED
jgi:ABC-2 type transport system permease protein